jgi:UPF0755 protein
MAKRAASFLVVILVLLGAAAAGAYYWIEREYHAAGPAQANLRIDIDPGSSVRAVLTRLAERGAIRDARLVEIYLRLHRQRPSIKAGRYEIPAGASAARILELLEQGVVLLEQLTVVEGSTFADLRRALEKHPAITVTLRGKSNAEVMSILGRPGEHPEGRFFPDTYRFAARTTDVELLKLAYANMQRVLENAWAQRDPTIPIKTPYEALILASVIEKETGLASERPMIAGVFTARLKKGMRLQSDPTVIYGIGEKYDGNIRSRDLTTDTPYNTYTRAGLPPTPIALPGRESVLAAVEPLDTGALYFVATGDGTGAHYFSKTLEEHNEAVRRYLIRFRRQNRP